MARPARSISTVKAPRAGRKHIASAGFDALADLSQALRKKEPDAVRTPARTAVVAQSSVPTASPPKASGEVTPARDDDELFRAAVRDVAPLRGNDRAELSAPKPAPIPRAPAADPDDAASPSETRANRAPDDDAQLFQSNMQDVTPLRHSAYYATATARTSPDVRARAGNAHDAMNLIDEFARLLPADTEGLTADELFRLATRGARPMAEINRAVFEQTPPRPEPVKRSEDEQAALRETLDAPLSLEDRLEMGDEAAFLRQGLPRRILTDLRRGRWVLQAELDLHGLNRDEARSALAAFLRNCLIRGHRCVRVIHGKGLGSPGKESILKRLSRGWLAQREEILAFCQASPNQGGSGALMVLLRGQSPERGNQPT